MIPYIKDVPLMIVLTNIWYGTCSPFQRNAKKKLDHVNYITKHIIMFMHYLKVYISQLPLKIPVINYICTLLQ